MTGAGYIRLGATMPLMLALMTPGDASRVSAPPSAQKARVRLVLDTNFGDAVARQYERLLPNVRVEVVTAVGSVPTVAAIQRGDADLGFAFADVAYFGYLQPAQQGTKPPFQVRGMAALEIVPFHLLVRAGVRADNPGDLARYRVGVGTALSGQTLLAGLLFQGYGLSAPVTQRDRRSDLLAGADATFATAYYPASTVTEAMNHGARLLPIDGPVVARIRREYPFVRSVTIPAGTYPGQAEDVATIGVDRLLIGSSALDEGLAYDLTRVFIESLPLISSSLHTSFRLTNLDQASATPIPLHAGAARYYRERELTR
jgi:TRAP transporter TAXI family solute receptor